MRASASPTLASWTALGAAGALAAVLLGQPGLVALCAPFALAAVAGLALAGDPEVRVTADATPERTLEGDAVVVGYELSAARGAAWVALQARLPDGLQARDRDAVTRILRLGPGQHRRVEVPATAVRWGGQVAGRARVRTTGALGGVWFTGASEPGAAVLVLPGTQRLRSLLDPMRTQIAIGTRRSRTRGEGLELAEVRPWVPGDQIRRLHWRATARRGAPYVADRHPERSADVVLFVDTWTDLAGGREGALALAVRATAALADAHVHARDRVGIVAFGGVLQWLAPGLGVRQALRIAEALARSEVVMSYVARDVGVVPPAILPARALVVALTPLLDERGAHALLDLCVRGHDLVVLEIDAPALLGDRRDAVHRLWVLRRRALRLRLQELGATVAAWDGVRPLEEVLGEVTASRRASRLRGRA